MKDSEFIKNTIDRFPKGYVFTYSDFKNKVKSEEALAKALNRLVASGVIAKLAKGKFYKPEQSPFGELSPDRYQVVKDLLYRNGKVEGYLTGLSVYNSLGLTTQVGSIIQIGKNEVRPSFKRGRYTISFVKQKNSITEENIPLLQILDAVRFIKKIPDSSIGSNCQTLKSLIANLGEREKEKVIKLAMKYQPSTRALLGAILDDLGRGGMVDRLKKSLNRLTTYALPGAADVLASASRWNIK